MNPKTSQLDLIPTPLLVECLDPLLPSLTALVNSSLSSGVFPQVFKIALVTPLLKNHLLTRMNRRTIVMSPTSPLSLRSKLVLSQLSDLLSANNLYNHFQSTYRPGHSTETALLKIVNDVLLALHDGTVSLLTLLDLSAAFDTIDHSLLPIDHSLLLHRFHHDFGIQGTAPDWFLSYLTNCVQLVSIHCYTSEPAPTSFGVPRGSVLGYVLFALCTAPFSTVI